MEAIHMNTMKKDAILQTTPHFLYNPRQKTLT